MIQNCDVLIIFNCLKRGRNIVTVKYGLSEITIFVKYLKIQLNFLKLL